MSEQGLQVDGPSLSVKTELHSVLDPVRLHAGLHTPFPWCWRERSRLSSVIIEWTRTKYWRLHSHHTNEGLDMLLCGCKPIARVMALPLVGNYPTSNECHDLGSISLKVLATYARRKRDNPKRRCLSFVSFHGRRMLIRI